MEELLRVIRTRQSARTPYDPSRTVPKEYLKQVLEAARWSPTAHNMQNFEVVVVDDPKLLRELGSIPGAVSETFIRENYEQLSFSEEELRRKKVGILGTMFPPSWRTRQVQPSSAPEARIEPAEASLAVAAPQTRLLSESAMLLVVLYDPARRAPASEGDFLGIMSLGCVMQSMWLMASSLGMGFQILSALSGKEMEPKVKDLLHIPHHLCIAFSARLGFPAVTPKYLRVRRNIEDFAHHNHYGTKEFVEDV